MPEVKTLIDPRELASFDKVQKAIAKAREQADRVTEITDRAQLGEASDALRAIKFARKDVDDAKKAEKAPYTETAKRIGASFDEVKSPLLAAEERLKEAVAGYHERERKAHDEARKREEANARRRQERENKKAEEENRMARDKINTAPPPPPPPPPSSRGDIGQTTVKEVTKYEVVDESQVPDRFFDRVLSKGRLRSAVMAGEVVPGVRRWKEPEVATR